jgi:hypothetical protein
MAARFLGHRVDTAFMPGVTGSDAAQGKPSTAHQPKSFDGRDRVL